MHHGKSKGKVFQLFQEFMGEDMFINCSINFFCKLIIFHTGIGQHKDV